MRNKRALALVMEGSEGRKSRRLIARGLVWNGGYRVLEAGLSFGAMLILVRIIPPYEYGRSGAVLGWLAFLNGFSSAVFAAQALQEPESQEPDWSLHWSAGMYIQALLLVACEAIAGFCWLSTRYQSIAPLLHLATLGIVLDWPAQLRAVMLRRALDFRRLKILMGYSIAIKLATTVGVAMAGGGAYALVLGSHVVPAVPLVIDLLVVERWRPRDGWWHWPDWTAYRPAIRFGCQQAGSSLVTGIRSAAEAAILPGTLGYLSIGLLGRAQALISTTIGRIANIVTETLYPLLPTYASEPKRYAQYAGLFAQAFLLVALPGVLYMGLEGREVSRLVYGDRWVAADPLIWPAAVGALGLSVFTAGSSVLLGANHLRACFVLDSAAAALSIPMLAVAWSGGGLAYYAWALAVGQVAAGTLALSVACSRLGMGWMRSALIPPALPSILALGPVLIAKSLGANLPTAAGLLVDASVYGLTIGLGLRIFFPGVLANALSFMPWGHCVHRWLRLHTVPVVLKERA